MGASATVHVFFDPVLLTIVAEGRLTPGDVFEVIRTRYPTFTGGRILWDLTHADTSEFSRVEFQCIALAALKVAPEHPEAKTAFVVPDERAFARMRDYIRVANTCRVPARYEVFTEQTNAKEWLMADDESPRADQRRKRS